MAAGVPDILRVTLPDVAQCAVRVRVTRDILYRPRLEVGGVPGQVLRPLSPRDGMAFGGYLSVRSRERALRDGR
jgi:hypothetical protein